MLAYRTKTGSVPTYFHSLLRIYIPSRSLRSASERHLVVPSQRGSKSLSRTFSFTIPGWWNDLPTHIRNCWIPVNLQATTENSSLSTQLDFIIKKEYFPFINFHLSLYGSHITLQPKTDCPLKLSRVEPGQYLDGRPPGKTRLLLKEVLVRPAGGAHPVVSVGPNAPV